MDNIEKEVKRRKEAIEMYGSHHPFSKGGYTIDVPLSEENRFNEELSDNEIEIEK